MTDCGATLIHASPLDVPALTPSTQTHIQQPTSNAKRSTRARANESV